MILILSSQYDITTQDVCQWLNYQKKDFILLHSNDTLSLLKLTPTELVVSVPKRNLEININEVTSYWYRRDELNFISETENIKNDIPGYIQHNIQNDLFTVREYMHYFLEQKKILTSVKSSSVNKLIVLKHAKDLGLNVPNYILTNSKNELNQFYDQYKDVIYKTPSPGIQSNSNSVLISSLTQKLNSEDIDGLTDKFGLSFFQEQIDKKFEIRSLYIGGKFYSMAIISQNNEKTKVDYRNHDDVKPNRKVPYKLDEHTEKQLTELCKSLGLQFGSIDLIVGTDEKIYFLEINPIGQFGSLSESRNDFIERKIATILH